MADNVISNEDIYREAWASFVDATIEKHWASGGMKMCEERVGLKDLIQLEEVLSKLIVQENPVPISNRGSASFSSQKGQVHTRKPLATVADIPPLFENPLPSFFASMFATTVMAENDVGHRIDPSLSCEVDPTEGAVCAQASKHLAEQLAEVASREIDRILSQEGRYVSDSNAQRSVPSAREGEHPAHVGIKDYSLQRDPGPNHELVDTQNIVDADATAILEDGGKPEAIEASIEAREWEDPPHKTESPRVIEPQNIESATHFHVMDPRQPPRIEARLFDDLNTPKSPNVAEQTLVLEKQSPPDSRSTCSLAREASSGPSCVDVVSLTAHLDAIHIKIESVSGPDESFYASSSTVPQEQDEELEVTMLEASQCHTDEGCYADGAESFIGDPRSDKDKMDKSTSIVHGNDPLMNGHPLSWTRANETSEEREQLNINACGDILDESEIQVSRIESGDSREAGSNSLAALSLSQHQSPGEGPTSASGQRSCLEDASLENCNFGASQYRTSDSFYSVGRMGDMGDINVKPCEVVEKFQLMSLTGGVDGVLNSECSPAIVSFQFDGDAPSPLPIVEPNFIDERSDEHDEGGISQTRSMGSESTLEPNEATVERCAVAAIYDGEEIPETPLVESPSLHSDDPEECESKGSVCTPSPHQRQEDFESQEQPSSVRLLTPEMQLPGIARDLSDFDERGYFSPDIHPVASPAARLVQEERDSLSGSDVKSRYEDGGDEACCEHTSVGSFSDSEKSQSRIESDCDRGKQGEPKEADASLVEGTPRRHRCESQENLAGFYAPLMVTNIAGAPKDISLTITQKRTLHWMTWREGTDETIRGGILGHLATEEASICIATLVRNTPRPGFGTAQVRDKARLPCGGTLLIAPTKDAAQDWIDRLGGGARLSVMSYLMPLKERRRLKAEQAATFDAVVTTYDILKAKEVAMTSAVEDVTNIGVWHTRKAQKDRRRVSSKTNSMMSLLHGIWWDRVVADGAHILGNPLSARVMAMAGLVGGVRWCVVGRESMSTVESTSERMRSLTAFLGVPSEVPLVDVAGCLFFRSRPRHIAPVLYRNTVDEATLSEDETQKSEGVASNTRPQQRTLVDPAGMTEKIVGRGQSKRGLSRGRRSQQRRDYASANRPSCDESVGMRDTLRPSRRDEIRQYVPTVLQLVKSRNVRPAPSTDGV